MLSKGQTMPGMSETEVTIEHGVIRKDWRGRIRVALVYPNHYHVGMANLGFQKVYQLLNDIETVVCERMVLPPLESQPGGLVLTIESGKPLTAFDIVAFSLSFENDFPNILRMLSFSKMPILAAERQTGHPLVIAGGVACMLNPEPIAPFFDCFLIGEAEETLPAFIRLFRHHDDRKILLERLVQEAPGAYVPSFYDVAYQQDGTIREVVPHRNAPDKIQRVFLKDLDASPTCSTIVSPHASFATTFLVEVSRGCAHGCRFCSAGYVYRPPRFRVPESLAASLDAGLPHARHMGLVGAAVSDLPDLAALCGNADEKGIRLSFSSLRADALTPDLLVALRKAHVKTATIAPDAGSERMRQVINKGITEDDILFATEALVSNDIPNLKLYFMVGLPTETEADVEEIVVLCKKIKNVFLSSSRLKGRIGSITVSLNTFVPKPVTPFQWAGMAPLATLKKKIRHIRNGLKKIPNVRLHAESPRNAYVQALLSRGDRRSSALLQEVHRNGGNWQPILKKMSAYTDGIVYREREKTEVFPWDVIDHGIDRNFLWNEYNRAMCGKPAPPCRPGSSCSVCGVCKV